MIYTNYEMMTAEDREIFENLQIADCVHPNYVERSMSENIYTATCYDNNMHSRVFEAAFREGAVAEHVVSRIKSALVHGYDKQAWFAF